MFIQEPEFIIIGAQKAGTTWLWNKLKRHPGTSLPYQKEIHYFGGVEKYLQGDDWYFQHFSELDTERIIGEASTSYFYDYLPYWHNDSEELVVNENLPPIPELITKKFPEIKVIVSLRDPVNRAISGYRHWMKKGKDSPLVGLKKVVLKRPKARIIEYGYYAKYLEMWKRYVPEERLFIIIFEEDIVDRADETLEKIYRFLNLDPDIKLENVNKIVHKSWSWNRTIFEYYASPITKLLGEKVSDYLANILTVWNRPAFNDADIEFLRSIYLPEKERLEQLTGRCLDCWAYGQNKA